MTEALLQPLLRQYGAKSDVRLTADQLRYFKSAAQQIQNEGSRNILYKVAASLEEQQSSSSSSSPTMETDRAYELEKLRLQNEKSKADVQAAKLRLQEEETKRKNALFKQFNQYERTMKRNARMDSDDEEVPATKNQKTQHSVVPPPPSSSASRYITPRVLMDRLKEDGNKPEYSDQLTSHFEILSMFDKKQRTTDAKYSKYKENAYVPGMVDVAASRDNWFDNLPSGDKKAATHPLNYILDTVSMLCSRYPMPDMRRIITFPYEQAANFEVGQYALQRSREQGPWEHLMQAYN